jgi:hypothetical protein
MPFISFILVGGWGLSGNRGQCGHCGHFFDRAHYYSEDYAIYFFRNPNYGLMWCYNCTYVSVLTQSKLLGIIPTPALQYKDAVHPAQLKSNNYFNRMDTDSGLVAGIHLVRMIWNCLFARAKLQTNSEEPYTQTVELALEKLPPELVALMISIVSRISRVIPLEQQIEEGAYMGRVPNRRQFEEILSQSPNKSAASEALEALSGYPNPP